MTPRPPSSLRRLLGLRRLARPSVALVLFCLLWQGAAAGQASQAPSRPEVELARLAQQITSPDLKTRMQAFYTLLRFRAAEFRSHPEFTGAVSTALIRGLAAENQFEKQAAARMTAKYLALEVAGKPLPQGGGDSAEGDYFGDILGAVAAIKDPRATAVLLDDLATGNMAMSAVAEAGDPVVPKLVQMLHATTPGTEFCNFPGTPLCLKETRFVTAFTLADMADQKIFASLSPESEKQIRNALLYALQSSNRIERGTAAKGLGALAEPGLEPTLARVALHDPVPGVRVNAVIGLGKLEGTAVHGLLAGIAQHDSDINVRQAAQAALERPRGR